MGGMDCLDMARDKDRWRTIIKVVMIFQVPCKCREFIDKPRNG
jgi:hypothetical protein